ncbi:MAG: hypothetical protein V3S89_11605 [Desulfobacterales bacterium]
MGEILRYNVQHIGDIVVGGVERMFDGVKRSTWGITTTYNIHDLERRRAQLVRKIGVELVEVRTASPELEVFNNDKLNELFTKLDTLDTRIAAHRQEREQRLNPIYQTDDTVEEAPAV